MTTLRKTPDLLLAILRRILPTIVIFTIILVLSALTFALITPTGLFDSFYWSIVTGFTVGFGDVLPTTVAAKSLTMILIPLSSIFWAITVGHITAIILGFRERELMCEVEALVDHFGIKVDYSGDGT